MIEALINILPNAVSTYAITYGFVVASIAPYILLTAALLSTAIFIYTKAKQ